MQQLSIKKANKTKKKKNSKNQHKRQLPLKNPTKTIKTNKKSKNQKKKQYVIARFTFEQYTSNALRK